MRYIDCQYFESIRPESASRAGGCVGGLIDNAIDEVQSQVDLYISRYLPLREVPPSLKGIMVDLVDYRLAEDDVTELMNERRKQAIALLEKIERSGFPEFIDDSGGGGSLAFGTDYVSAIDRSMY